NSMIIFTDSNGVWVFFPLGAAALRAGTTIATRSTAKVSLFMSLLLWCWWGALGDEGRSQDLPRSDPGSPLLPRQRAHPDGCQAGSRDGQGDARVRVAPHVVAV